MNYPHPMDDKTGFEATDEEMSDYFPFWMFCSVVAICITWYKVKTMTNDRQAED